MAASCASALPSITRISPRVVRILGQNPSPMTLGGTNTYLVGTGRQRALIDTGEGLPQYNTVLETVLQQESDALGKRVEISDVLLTHWHFDHVGGAGSVRQRFPNARFYKKPSAIKGLDPTDGVYSNFPTNPAELSVEGATLAMINTPGHTDEHVSLLLREENAIFTGDCVLGTGSSVFACFHEFMSSLELLKEMRPATLYPGHGPVVTDAIGRVVEYIEHRLKREKQIVAALSSLGVASIMDLVEFIYVDTPKNLHRAAAGNVLHQLKKLQHDGAVTLLSDSASPKATKFLSTSDYEMFKDEHGTSEEFISAFLDITTQLKWKLTNPQA